MTVANELPVVGVGVVSYGRPAFRSVAVSSAQTCHADHMVTVVDVAPVARAKNKALVELLRLGCDWLFLMEDDIEVIDPYVAQHYIEACGASGFDHLMFHAHGSLNQDPNGCGAKVTFWPHSVGAWCVYSRRSLEVCGLFDENFYNAWEHVEHSQRLALAGFTPTWPHNADATGSEGWLREQPGAWEDSAIRQDAGWSDQVQAGEAYWKTNMPETYSRIFG